MSPTAIAERPPPSLPIPLQLIANDLFVRVVVLSDDKTVRALR